MVQGGVMESRCWRDVAIGVSAIVIMVATGVGCVVVDVVGSFRLYPR